jgi:hypothetical protein
MKKIVFRYFQEFYFREDEEDHIETMHLVKVFLLRRWPIVDKDEFYQPRIPISSP